MVYAWKTRRALPGFGLALGFTLLYLSLIVLMPLSTIFLKTAALSWPEFWSTVASSRTLAAFVLLLAINVLQWQRSAVALTGK
jgi:sulfate transport system permease protein